MPFARAQQVRCTASQLAPGAVGARSRPSSKRCPNRGKPRASSIRSFPSHACAGQLTGPAATSVQHPTFNAVPPPAWSAGGGPMRTRILIVEDDDTVRTTLEDCLSSVYDVITTRSGSHALKLLGHADLILVDLVMDGMSGQDFIANVRERGFGHLPMIVLSADPRVDIICAALRVAHFLRKPEGFAQL